MKYKISQYTKKNNVTVRTVWNWIKDDKVVTEKLKLVVDLQFKQKKLKMKEFLFILELLHQKTKTIQKNKKKN